MANRLTARSIGIRIRTFRVCVVTDRRNVITNTCANRIYKEAKYVQRNTDAQSWKHWCRTKSKSICVWGEGGGGGECPHYPACKAHAHYYVIFGLVILPYISTLSHKRQEFRKKLTEQKVCTFISSRVFTWNISRSKNNSVRCYHKCTYVYI